MEWTHLAQDRNKWWAFVNTGSIKCGEFLDRLRTLLHAVSSLGSHILKAHRKAGQIVACNGIPSS